MDAVNIKWIDKGDHRYLLFEFVGDLTPDVATRAIETWQKHFDQLKEGEKVGIVWNCLSMKKYSASSALMWKNSLPKFSPQIDQIWLITTNSFFKMGARTVTMLTSFKLRIASSMEVFLKAEGEVV